MPRPSLSSPNIQVIKLNCIVYLEPVGRVPPKFPSIDNSRGFNAYIEASVTLLCPAQAFPVPLFR